MSATQNKIAKQDDKNIETVFVDPKETGIRQIELPCNRELRVHQASSELAIVSDQGEVELKIKITDSGPVLVFNQANLSLENSGNIDIKCKDLNIQTDGALTMESNGDFKQRVAGNHAVHVRDDMEMKAQAVDIESELGQLQLKANDDVALNGLRILMNVPNEQEVVEKARSLKSFSDFLKMPFVDPGGSKRLPKGKPVKRDDW